MSAQDDDLLATLTPEERAAIEDTDQEEQAALARIAAGGDGDGGADDSPDDDGGADDAGAGGDGDESATTAAAEPAATQTTAAATAEPEAQPAPAAPKPVPATYRAELPADFAEQKSALEEQAKALADQFRAGEIELSEFETKRADLDTQRDKLLRQELKAEISQEMSAQTAEQLWSTAIANQLEAAKKPEHGGIDYNKDPEKMGDLDAFVRQLGARAENADKSMEWFLAEAHRRVLALHGVAATAPPKPKADAIKEAVDKRRPLDAAVPPSVAHVPGADGAGDIRDEFADLDRLEGVELEAALSRLTPAQREKYAAGV
jgi:hypothetical protein